jgi:DNA-binding response OmpR family regulator
MTASWDEGVSDAVASIADRAGVELVVWPAYESRRQHLARAGVPRLLLVEALAEVPHAVGLDEDWVRLPADDRDLLARLERLSAAVEHLRTERPVLDSRHMLHFAGAHVVLTRQQAAVVAMLLEHPGATVSRDRLEAAAWPGGDAGPRALDAVVFRVRRRLAGLGLVVRNAHAHGFAIDLPASGPDVHSVSA